MAQASEENVCLDDVGLARVLDKVKAHFSRKVVQIPIDGEIKTYVGEPISPTYDLDSIDLTGSYSNTVVGTYEYTATLKDIGASVWSDGTVYQKTLSYTINKASNWLTVDKDELTFYAYKNDADKVINIIRKSTGTINISSSEYLNINVSEDQITIGLNQSNLPVIDTNISLLLSDGGDSNIMPANKTINVSILAIPDIVSWPNGTDEQINDMIVAADKGLIDLKSYWSNGDERIVHLPAIQAYSTCVAQPEQDIVLILDDTDQYTLTSARPDGSANSVFGVYMKECFNENTNIGHEGQATSGSYDNYYWGYRFSACKTWIADNLLPNLPDFLKNNLKAFNCDISHFYQRDSGVSRGSTVGFTITEKLVPYSSNHATHRDVKDRAYILANTSGGGPERCTLYYMDGEGVTKSIAGGRSSYGSAVYFPKPSYTGGLSLYGVI